MLQKVTTLYILTEKKLQLGSWLLCCNRVTNESLWNQTDLKSNSSERIQLNLLLALSVRSTVNYCKRYFNLGHLFETNNLEVSGLTVSSGPSLVNLLKAWSQTLWIKLRTDGTRQQLICKALSDLELIWFTTQSCYIIFCPIYFN